MRARREKQPAQSDGFDGNFSSNRLVHVISILNLHAAILQRKQQVDRQFPPAFLYRDDNAVYTADRTPDRKILKQTGLRESDRQSAALLIAKMVPISEHLRTACDANPQFGPRFDFM